MDREGYIDGRKKMATKSAELKGMSRAEARRWCFEKLGWKPNRSDALWKAMYGPPYARRVQEVGSLVSKHALLELSEAKADLRGGLEDARIGHEAVDGTKKLLFNVHGIEEGSRNGNKDAVGVVEAVLIPTTRRATVCVSSQLGCAMKCQFCRTGQMGFRRNLSAAQIVEQVVGARKICLQQDHRPHPSVKTHDGAIPKEELSRMPAHAQVSNVVFMGMGEPLQNLDAVIQAVDIMTTSPGLQISPNKITVSTCGLVPQMEAFLKKCDRAQIALSLHATTDDIRSAIMPVNEVHPLREVLQLLEAEFPKEVKRHLSAVASSHHVPYHSTDSKSKQAKRHVCIEYVLLRGINDSKHDAQQLVQLLRNIRCKVNLIEFNAFPMAIFQASHPETTEEFLHTLRDAGLVATLRRSRGEDAMAACGQLGQVNLKC